MEERRRGMDDLMGGHEQVCTSLVVLHPLVHTPHASLHKMNYAVLYLSLIMYLRGKRAYTMEISTAQEGKVGL